VLPASAALVQQLLPGCLVVVRFGWPVFPCENVFLVRHGDAMGTAAVDR
jgi:hypothetical protein